MPREGQIIPEYKVPHVKTYINDNSVYEDVSATVSETGIRFLNVFASEKGEDGVVKMIRSAAEYIDEYGTPNYELYGQPCYMPYAALQTGNARCWCMRVMPSDATYANLVVVAKAKAVDITTIHASNGVNIDATNGDIASANMANNVDKFIVGDFEKVGNDMEVTVKGTSALETVTLQSDGQAWEGQWIGLIIDTGSEINGSTYITKHGTPVTMGVEGIKESAAAGGYEYEVKKINGVDTYIVKGTYEEVKNESGTVIQVNYQPYSQYVQWINFALDENGEPVDTGVVKTTETINDIPRTVLTRKIETRNKENVSTVVTVKFIPYIEGETVSEFSNFKIKYEAQTVEGFTDKDSLPMAIANVAPVDDDGNYQVDEEGYTVIPVMGVCAKGRGEYGNSIRIRITTDVAADKENGYKNYIIEVLTNDTTLIRKEYFRACMYEESIVDAASLYANDVINDVDNGSGKINFYVNSDGFKYIYDLYSTEVAPFLDEKVQTTLPLFDEFDFLFGKYKANVNKSIPSFGIVSTIPFSGTDGLSLADGTEGSFDANSPDREEAMTSAYIEAFSGKNNYDENSTIYSNAILSKRRTPCEFILDANYPSDVKAALVQLAKTRYDAQLVLDATINTTTISQAIKWSNENIEIADPIISKECSSYKVKDPFNGKIITVTSTYNMAKMLPNHWSVYGNHIPFVGSRYSLLTDFVKNSVKPAIDADDMTVKETLYNNHVNFYECIAENRFIKGTQTTSQTITSDLSEMNNVAVMLEMKRKLEDYVSSQIYNFTEASERARFTSAADELFIGYNNKKVQSYSVYFDMNEFEEKRNILHCYLTIVFRTMAKRGIIEIDINKRV